MATFHLTGAKIQASHRNGPKLEFRTSARQSVSTSRRVHKTWAASTDVVQSALTIDQTKAQMLKLASLTDRGQRHNKLVSNAYTEEENRMKDLVEELVKNDSEISEQTLEGSWELVYASVELFRSSPFFLAIENALGQRWKSDLFFKLHLLQVGSWGASTVGRISQRLDFKNEVMESEFDTILFGLTVIPIVGWFKLLPTFGGRVVTVSKDFRLEGKTLHMEVDKTRVVETPGVDRGLLGKLLMNRWAPVNTVWKILPWNWGGAPTCSVTVRYVDDDMRVMEDKYGQIFVYIRPLL